MIKRLKYKGVDSYCVVHGHPPNPENPNDKPIGTPIKCYSIAKYGKDEALKKAQAMHYAIVKSQEKRKKG